MRIVIGPRREEIKAAFFRDYVAGLVKEAVARISDVEPVLVFAEDAGADAVDAVLWVDVFAPSSVAPLPTEWPDTPTAIVEFEGQYGVLRLQHPLEMDEIQIVQDERDGDVRAIAEIRKWLTRHVDGVSQQERQMLEVVAGLVIATVDRGDVIGELAAQFRSAAETIETQLRTPKPSRRVLSWAIGQLKQFPIGFLSGAAATYLPILMNHFAR